MKATIIGGGVIGGGWAARFLLNGWDVAIYDPDPDAARKIDAVLENARRALPALYDRPMPAEGALSFHTDMKDAAANADWVQESVPERLEIKHRVLGVLGKAAPNAVIASSTSGFKPSDLNAAGARAIVAHPFNPVYLLPLVELVGDQTETKRAADLLTSIGMYPLQVRKEIDAHIADRFLEAVWREALWLVKDGIATTEEIDEAIRMGFGLRWAQMGLFETYRIAGGEAGMRHFLAQFGPALKWPWTRLMDVPDFDEALVDLIAGQSDAQSGALSIRDLERLRDDNLVAMMRALKGTGSGAGGVLVDHQTAIARPSLPIVAAQKVPASWMDLNGHMNIAHYVEMTSNAIEGFQTAIGAGARYIDTGYSFFTVENHIRYLSEVRAGEDLSVTVRVLGQGPRKMHLWFEITAGQARLAATVECMLVHVDLQSRRACPIPAAMAQSIAGFVEESAKQERPADLTLSL